jgi:hypothetical protein
MAATDESAAKRAKLDDSDVPEVMVRFLVPAKAASALFGKPLEGIRDATGTKVEVDAEQFGQFVPVSCEWRACAGAVTRACRYRFRASLGLAKTL